MNATSKNRCLAFFLYIYIHARMRLQVLEFLSCKLHKIHWKLTDYKCCSSRLTSLLNHYMKIPAIGLVTRVNRGNSRLNQENKWDSLKAGIWQIIFGVFSPQSTCPHQKEKKKRNLQLFLISGCSANSVEIRNGTTWDVVTFKLPVLYFGRCILFPTLFVLFRTLFMVKH